MLICITFGIISMTGWDSEDNLDWLRSRAATKSCSYAACTSLVASCCSRSSGLLGSMSSSESLILLCPVMTGCSWLLLGRSQSWTRDCWKSLAFCVVTSFVLWWLCSETQRWNWDPWGVARGFVSGMEIISFKDVIVDDSPYNMSIHEFDNKERHQVLTYTCSHSLKPLWWVGNITVATGGISNSVFAIIGQIAWVVWTLSCCRQLALIGFPCWKWLYSSWHSARCMFS